MLEKALQRLGRGENSALDEIYEQTAKTVFAVAYSYTRNKFAAEDISQETYINIMRYISYYKPNTNPKAWIIQIAKNASLNYLKKTKREATENIEKIYELQTDEKTDQKFESDELVKLIEKSLDQVTANIVLLHLIGDMTFEEISRVTETNGSTVRWKYGKAMKSLEKILRENGYE
ncbi:MAG TPA: RNA polymerase sigma factor [Eubacteriales bacterium]|nr:RNA polymerase sigma factor [Eubacteriales bacterium]